MPGLTDSLRILITANGAQAEREFAKVGASARRNLGVAETSAQRYGSVLTSAGVAMATFGAVALVGLGMAARASEEELAALLRLENTIQNVPELAGASTDAFLEQAAALQDTTKFSDDATVSAQALLGQFGLTQDQILELVPLVQDYAAKMGVDLDTAARAVGKATAGTNTTLKRAGIQFNETAYAADNFQGTIDALSGSVGGFAAQEGQTLSGQLAILKNNFDDIIESLGTGAASAFSDLIAPVGALADALGSLDPSTQNLIGRILTFGAVGITAAGGVAFLAGQAMKLSAALTALRTSAIVTQASVWAMSTSVGQGLALLAPQITAVAVAAAASYVVLKDYVESVGEIGPSSETATAGTAALITTLAETGSAAEALGMVVDNAVESGGALADTLTISGTSAAEFANILASTPAQNYGAAIAAIASEVEAAGGSYEEAQFALADFAALQQDSARGAVEAVRAQGNMPAALIDSAIAANTAEGGFTNFLGVLGMLGRYDPDVFGPLEGSAADAAAAVDDLDQEIRDYLDGIYSIPAAQRDVREAFQNLTDVLGDEESTADDVAVALEGITEETGYLGSASGTMAAAAQLSIARLRQMADNGEISRETFRNLRDDILGLPGARDVPVSTPGAAEARSQVQNLTDALFGVPPDTSPNVSAPGATSSRSQVNNLTGALLGVPPQTSPRVSAPGATQSTGQVKSLDSALRKVPPSTSPNVYTDVARSNFDSLMADISGAISKSYSINVAVKTIGDPLPKSGGGNEAAVAPDDIFVPAPVGAGKSARMAKAGGRGGGDVLVTVPVHLDGEKIAEVVAKADRRFNTARGGDSVWG